MDARLQKNSDDALVSIIVPVYNVEDYIERCINSIIRQSYKNIECIIVDDCGSDRSIAKASEIIDQYKGPISFTIIRHEKNRGLSAGRNTGTAVANGKYVYYLDSDDEITEDCIQLFLDVFSSNPNLEIVQGNVESKPKEDYSGSGFTYNLDYMGLPTRFDSNTDIVNWYFNINHVIPVNAWNKLIRVEFIKHNNLYFREGILHEDEHWMYFVIMKLNHIYYLHKKTYIHYRTENSIMTSTKSTKLAKHWSIILNDFIDNINVLYKKQCINKIMYHFFIEYFNNRYMDEYKLLYTRIYNLCVENHQYLSIAALFSARIASKIGMFRRVPMNIVRYCSNKINQ